MMPEFTQRQTSRCLRWEAMIVNVSIASSAAVVQVNDLLVYEC